jgi:hypothetical protein
MAAFASVTRESTTEVVEDLHFGHCMVDSRMFLFYHKEGLIRNFVEVKIVGGDGLAAGIINFVLKGGKTLIASFCFICIHVTKEY